MLPRDHSLPDLTLCCFQHPTGKMDAQTRAAYHACQLALRAAGWIETEGITDGDQMTNIDHTQQLGRFREELPDVLRETIQTGGGAANFVARLQTRAPGFFLVRELGGQVESDWLHALKVALWRGSDPRCALALWSNGAQTTAAKMAQLTGMVKEWTTHNGWSRLKHMPPIAAFSIPNLLKCFQAASAIGALQLIRGACVSSLHRENINDHDRPELYLVAIAADCGILKALEDSDLPDRAGSGVKLPLTLIEAKRELSSDVAGLLELLDCIADHEACEARGEKALISLNRKTSLPIETGFGFIRMLLRGICNSRYFIQMAGIAELVSMIAHKYHLKPIKRYNSDAGVTLLPTAEQPPAVGPAPLGCVQELIDLAKWEPSDWDQFVAPLDGGTTFEQELKSACGPLIAWFGQIDNTIQAHGGYRQLPSQSAISGILTLVRFTGAGNPAPAIEQEFGAEAAAAVEAAAVGGDVAPRAQALEAIDNEVGALIVGDGEIEPDIEEGDDDDQA
jgi:hypothetical protein